MIPVIDVEASILEHPLGAENPIHTVDTAPAAVGVAPAVLAS